MEQIINGEHVLIGERFAGSARTESGVRYRFAPDCYLTHFDDGRWRVVMYEHDEFRLQGWDHTKDDGSRGRLVEFKYVC
ncbi:MAG: hypothetical protein ACRDSE_14625 [Pseudonocardiaceae bacterium]